MIDHLTVNGFNNFIRSCATLFRAPHRPEEELSDELRKKDTKIPLSVHWDILI
jgi:hypothetical protein